MKAAGAGRNVKAKKEAVGCRAYAPRRFLAAAPGVGTKRIPLTKNMTGFDAVQPIQNEEGKFAGIPRLRKTVTIRGMRFENALPAANCFAGIRNISDRLRFLEKQKSVKKAANGFCAKRRLTKGLSFPAEFWPLAAGSAVFKGMASIINDVLLHLCRCGIEPCVVFLCGRFFNSLEPLAYAAVE